MADAEIQWLEWGFKGFVGLSGFLGAAWGRWMMGEHKDMKSSVISLKERLSSNELSNVNNYVQKTDFKETVVELKDTVKRVYDKIDQILEKLDRRPH